MNNALSVDAIRAEGRQATCGHLSDLVSSGALRGSLGLSKTAFAGLLDIKRQTILAYESGVTLPALSVVLSVADIFNIAISKYTAENTQAQSASVPPTLAAIPERETVAEAMPQRDWGAELIALAVRRAEAERLSPATLKRQRAAVNGCQSVLKGDPLSVASWYAFIADDAATSTQASNAKLVAAVAAWAAFNGVPELMELAGAIKIALSGAGSHRD